MPATNPDRCVIFQLRATSDSALQARCWGWGCLTQYSSYSGIHSGGISSGHRRLRPGPAC